MSETIWGNPGASEIHRQVDRTQHWLKLLQGDAIHVVESKVLGSRACFMAHVGLRSSLYVFSLNAFLQMTRGVEWHDEPSHCRTWSGGECRCDVEPT